MASSPDANDEAAALAALAEIDLRGVAVLWSGDEQPTIENLGGCHDYEAMTLLRLAYNKLEADCALPLEDDEDEPEGAD